MTRKRKVPTSGNRDSSPVASPPLTRRKLSKQKSVPSPSVTPSPPKRKYTRNASKEQLREESSSKQSKSTGGASSSSSQPSSKKGRASTPPPTQKQKGTKKKKQEMPESSPSPSPSPEPEVVTPKKFKGKTKAVMVTGIKSSKSNRNVVLKSKLHGKKKKLLEKMKAKKSHDICPAGKRRRNFMPEDDNKWNFGPMSSINRRRREEMMEFFPAADFTPLEEGVPRVLNNFKRATIRYDMDVINKFITCRLCDGYLIDATTIIDCMHTYCKSCLLMYFEKDNNTCPTCGIFIHGSHPAQYVTYDRAINDLVNHLVPGLEQKEKDNRNQFLADCRDAAGIDTTAEQLAKAERKEQERITGTNRCYQDEGDPWASHHRDDNQVTIKLIPGGKNLPLVSRPFLRTSEMTTMSTLKKYLALQMWDDQNRYMDLDIYCDNQLMGKDFSIRFVWMMKRRNQPKFEPLVIRYKYADKD